jgi:hypothetical protein
MPTYCFTPTESEQAHEEWGANCGPNALAFALQVHISKVRPLIPHFEERRYTNPTMMKTALETAGRRFVSVHPGKQTRGKPADVERMFSPEMALTRIQWDGPWCEPGVPAAAAYRQTHWIATWEERGVPLIFDVNGGLRGLPSWEEEIVPAIVATIPRANGYWWPTHIYRLKARSTVSA